MSGPIAQSAMADAERQALCGARDARAAELAALDSALDRDHPDFRALLRPRRDARVRSAPPMKR